MFSKYFNLIKDTYSELNIKVKDLGTKSIFDNKFGVYNKKYIVNYMSSLLDNISKIEGKSDQY